MPNGLQLRRPLGRLYTALWGGCLLMLSQSATARFDIPGYELVYTAPVETALQADDLRNTAEVWQQMFDAAKTRIDLGQFYVANQQGSLLDGVLQHLKAAGERGVKIRFLMEEKGIRISTPETLEQLKAIPNLELRIIPYQRLSGGILHAKYLLVDGEQAFVGSQNFDWRALAHIHETGLRISDAGVVGQIQAIFEQDWQAQALLAADKPVPQLPYQPSTETPQGNYLVASPRAYNPAGVIDSQVELPRLLATAKQRVRVQVMDYTPLSYGPEHSRPYYAVIDNALRSAAARGVQVELMVANWNTKKPDIAWLKSLAVVPNVQIKIVTIPPASSGFIPFARVIHSKIMTIDGATAWIGTSNWTGGYLDNSRNLELVLHNPAMSQRVDKLYSQLWDSVYAEPIKLDYDYPAPKPGGES
ncbi:cardiolipin synthetase [Serratia quinivorans]|uniref:phospholipase D-like domain-containing protein n=1 Tax=Serratia quinivorans TaxID=137545 RepID=UPI0021771A13|nr:phospholipase D-like domain-containing protein [Serratia quinivorans]CAI1032787.1 cardiolipin synthetase [Serratia quinivorans]CAI1062130.1 cardiolipin synthetase [Serratia quinivorans]CAI1802335.1 cardiolipin synthetase [Serratia quinivorans]CAI1953265.1 cardiolipin synthetase [Serratia quinivorans]CAI2108868.1 cardiolipin synthetase [Serratia quinivorans]